MDLWSFVVPAIPATIFVLVIWAKDRREFADVHSRYGVTQDEWEAAKKSAA